MKGTDIILGGDCVHCSKSLGYHSRGVWGSPPLHLLCTLSIALVKVVVGCEPEMHQIDPHLMQAYCRAVHDQKYNFVDADSKQLYFIE